MLQFTLRRIQEEIILILRDITLDDKNLLDKFEYISSDYRFSYLYMYSENYKYKIADDDNSVFIYSGTCNPSFYMPLGDTERGIEKVMDYCRQNNIKPVFSKITKKYTELFRCLGFKVEEDRNSFDYIFRNSCLAAYKGKQYRKQRNNLSSLLRSCTPEYSTDLKSHIDECRAFAMFHYGSDEILKPTMRIMDILEYTGCDGGIVTCDGSIESFCIYEKISADTVISHVELTNNAIRGVHAFMIKEMSGKINEEYINKEDDIGIPGLRRFKMSYNPCSMIEKYTASIVDF